MTTQKLTADAGAVAAMPGRRDPWPVPGDALYRLESAGPLAVSPVAETAEAVIGHIQAPIAAGPVMRDGLKQSLPDVGSGPPQSEQPEAAVARAADQASVSVDEYAKAVLYNGLGHYRAAQAAATAGLPTRRLHSSRRCVGRARRSERSMRRRSRGCGCDPPPNCPSES